MQTIFIMFITDFQTGIRSRTWTAANTYDDMEEIAENMEGLGI